LGYPGVIGFAGRLGAFFTLAFTSPSVPAANFTRCSWRATAMEHLAVEISYPGRQENARMFTYKLEDE